MPHTSPTYSLSLSSLSPSPSTALFSSARYKSKLSRKFTKPFATSRDWRKVYWIELIHYSAVYHNARWPLSLAFADQASSKHSLESGTKRNRLTYRLAALLCHKSFDEIIIINKVLVQKLTGVFKLWQESWWIFIVKWLQSNLSLDYSIYINRLSYRLLALLWHKTFDYKKV